MYLQIASAVSDQLEVPEVCVAPAPYCEFVAAIDPDDFNFRVQVTQNRDPTIVDLRIKLEKEEMPNFAMINGLVYRSKDDVSCCTYP